MRFHSILKSYNGIPLKTLSDCVGFNIDGKKIPGTVLFPNWKLDIDMTLRL